MSIEVNNPLHHACAWEYNCFSREEIVVLDGADMTEQRSYADNPWGPMEILRIATPARTTTQVTSGQAQKEDLAAIDASRRTCLSFLDLPRELRDTIYMLCFDLSSIQRAIDLAVYFKSSVTQVRKTPNIFVLNRQISEEALDIMRRFGVLTRQVCQPLYFSLELFVSRGVLQHIQSLVLQYDPSYEIQQDDSYPYCNYCRLHIGRTCVYSLVELVGLLRMKHSLKRLQFQIVNQGVLRHLAEYESGLNTDRKSSCLRFLDDYVALLKLLRGVDTVVIKGLPKKEAAVLQELIQRPRLRLMALPLDVLNIIFNQALGHDLPMSKHTDSVSSTIRVVRKDCATNDPYPYRLDTRVVPISNHTHWYSSLNWVVRKHCATKDVIPYQPVNPTAPALLFVNKQCNTIASMILQCKSLQQKDDFRAF